MKDIDRVDSVFFLGWNVQMLETMDWIWEGKSLYMRSIIQVFLHDGRCLECSAIKVVEVGMRAAFKRQLVKKMSGFRM